MANTFHPPVLSAQSCLTRPRNATHRQRISLQAEAGDWWSRFRSPLPSPTAAPCDPLCPCPGTQPNPAFIAHSTVPTGRPHSPGPNPSLPTRHPQFPSVPLSLCDMGGGCPGTFSSWSPHPAQNRGGEKAAGEWGGEVPPSLPMLSPPRLSLAGRQEQAPAPPGVTRGRSARVVAGWGGIPKLTRSGAASGGARSPRPQEPKHGWAGREPRLCSRGEARGGRHSRGRLGGGRVGGGAREPPAARVGFSSQRGAWLLRRPSSGLDARSSEPRFLLRVRNRGIGGPGQGCVAKAPIRFGA